ncbi:MAG: thiamine diphosphokinase [Oscillospiraceae bacterium]|nr:thiamine diphosphokinase [Oscillospiraceae bacterium]
MRIIIIGGGEIRDYDYIRARVAEFCADVIICADSGYNHAVKMGLQADYIVGDMDSLDLSRALQKPPKTCKFLQYPTKKDYTDSELALMQARELQATAILFAAVTGSRADHSLANIFMLKTCITAGIAAEIIDECNSIKLIDSRLEVEGAKGQLLSLIALSDCAGVNVTGAEYPLNNAALKVGESRGVSNVMQGKSATVTVREGLLLVVQNNSECRMQNAKNAECRMQNAEIIKLSKFNSYGKQL